MAEVLIRVAREPTGIDGQLVVRLTDLTDGIEASAPLDAELALAADSPASCVALVGALSPATTTVQRQVVGRRLYDGLITGDVRRLWDELLAGSSTQRPLRVGLEIGPLRLRALPWELLHDGLGWVFRDLRQRWRRVRVAAPAFAGRPPELAELGPLRVLLVVCNPQDRSLLADDELAEWGAALGRIGAQVHHHVLDGPDLSSLTVTLARLRPHVLHFIGHGALPGTDLGSAVAFNRTVGAAGRGAAGGDYWELTTDLAQVLMNAWQPWLVVINACRQGVDGTAPQDGLTEVFLDRGVQAVIALQGDVEPLEAVHLSAGFYRALAQRRPLDDAVATARDRLASDHHATAAWALPVLTAVHTGRLTLPVRFPLSEATARELTEHPDFTELRLFLGRHDERREGWWALSDDGTERPPSRLLVITGHSQSGGPKTGKTLLARWWLMTCLLRGEATTYVDLRKVLTHDCVETDGRRTVRRVTHKNWLDVLRVIRAACVDEDRSCHLPHSAFTGFHDTLHRELPDPHADFGPPTGEDIGLWFNDNAPRAEDRKNAVFRSFAEALSPPDQERRHLVVLDHPEYVLSESFRQELYPRLLAPRVLDGLHGRLRFVLVADPSWVREHIPPQDSTLVNTVALGDFETRHFMRLARDYCARAGIPFAAALPVFEGYDKYLQGTSHFRVDFLSRVHKTMDVVARTGPRP
ncbi:CHAT domain-containing protein [Streptomyces sp. NPDC059866]|uniref:CHAT domain-containing protein n=1 Tax=Streptomyces sp. NPDC059866 TaxID=3346978 RepID=UPI00365DF967